MFAAVVLALLAVSSTTNALSAPFYEPETWHNRTGIVHLFEWKWLDIAKECEEFLAPKGFGAVQVSPPTENLVIWRDGDRPWWERYQPVSYRLITRSGNEQEFEEMTRRCNAVGVRIYVDLVINHMAADHPSPIGTGGGEANPNEMSYPLVPYSTNHFHKPTCGIKNYHNVEEVRNCELDGLHDLDHAQPHVRDRIIDLMNRLIDLGVAGFRVDAAKHMWPHEVKMMMESMKPLNPKFGFAPDTKPFVYQEVLDLGNEPISYNEYTDIGRVEDFFHSKHISRVFSGGDQLRWLRNWGTEWDLVYGPKSVVFVDNHDNQRDGTTLTHKKSKQYKMAVAFMLAHPNGIPRVMSSFAFENRDQGPPMTPNGDLISPQFGPNGTHGPQCTNGYICEHRWRPISNMIAFRNSAEVTKVENWWDNGDNQIAFSRGNKAFIAFNNQDTIMDVHVPTGLPAGTYCDVISGNITPDGRACTGKALVVDESGKAEVYIHPEEEDGTLAVHVGSKVKV